MAPAHLARRHNDLLAAQGSGAPDDTRCTDIPEATPNGAVFDVDEADAADSFELPGADLSKEELLIQVIPVQTDEFTCVSCFLVHHRSQLAREKDGRKYCSECESRTRLRTLVATKKAAAGARLRERQGRG